MPEPSAAPPDSGTAPARENPARGTQPRTLDPGAAPAIRVTDLARTYASGKRVGPLSFTVPRGAITGLVGPNGVGKTTTIRMLLGLVTPSAGHVQLLDATSWAELPTVLGRVGALVDSPALVPTLTGRQNLLVLTRLAGWPDAVIERVLATVGLTDSADRRVKEYSLGMRQRLALAGALLGEPDLLIVDEPANGLDPQGVAQLRVLLNQIADSGTSIVVSSHVLSEVEQVCDYLVIMSERGVVYNGTRDDLTRQLKGSLRVQPANAADAPRLRALLRASGYLVDAETGPEVTLRETARSAVPDGGAVNTIAMEHGIVLARIEPRRQSLEDVFFELTGLPGSSADRLGVPVGSDAPGAGFAGPAPSQPTSGPESLTQRMRAWSPRRSRDGHTRRNP